MITPAEIDLLDDAAQLPSSTGRLRVLVRAGATVLGTLDVDGDPSHAACRQATPRRPLRPPAVGEGQVGRRVGRTSPVRPRGRDRGGVHPGSTRAAPGLPGGAAPPRPRPRRGGGRRQRTDHAPPPPSSCAERGVDPRGGTRAWPRPGQEPGLGDQQRTPVVAYVDDDARADRDFARAVGRRLHGRGDRCRDRPRGPRRAGHRRPALLRGPRRDGEGLRAPAVPSLRRPGGRGTVPGGGSEPTWRSCARCWTSWAGSTTGSTWAPPPGGGGDLDMLRRVLEAGHVALYEPAAVVHHIHRRDYRDLLRQSYDNGVAYAACLGQVWGRMARGRRAPPVPAGTSAATCGGPSGRCGAATGWRWPCWWPRPGAAATGAPPWPPRPSGPRTGQWQRAPGERKRCGVTVTPSTS